MDAVEIRIRLNYVEPLSAAEYTDMVDRFLTLVEREVAPGGELTLEETDLVEYEISHWRPLNGS